MTFFAVFVFSAARPIYMAFALSDCFWEAMERIHSFQDIEMFSQTWIHCRGKKIIAATI